MLFYRVKITEGPLFQHASAFYERLDTAQLSNNNRAAHAIQKYAL